MSDKEHPLVARLYDTVMAVPEQRLLPQHRESLVADLSGPVLDVGAGTGAMFPYFADHDLAVYAIEPDPHMRARARDRANELDLAVDISDARAENLPYDDDTFDTVVASLVFCTIPDIGTALDEVARVLRPGGEFRFVEHVRGTGVVGTLHDTLAPAWYHAAGGCNLDRETGDLFCRDDRFEILAYDRFESGPARVVPLVRGRLQRRGGSGFSRLFG